MIVLCAREGVGGALVSAACPELAEDLSSLALRHVQSVGEVFRDRGEGRGRGHRVELFHDLLCRPVGVLAQLIQ
jgi:hypothetical protein